MKKYLILLLLSWQYQPLFCQQTAGFSEEKIRFSALFGLTQPLITRGFNFEINYYTKNWVFDYSHGFNLHFDNKLVTGDAKAQSLKFKITHSLGFGVGYRFTPEFNLRIEPKIHLWNMYQDNSDYTKANVLKKYATYTLGLGAYYRWLPFKNANNIAKGLSVVPSFRWWPNIGSSLDNNSYTYSNAITKKTESHKANNIGVNNSPFFGNVSIGYTFW